VGPAPRGRCCWSFRGGAQVCTRDVFIFNEVGAEHKTYIVRHFAWMTYFAYRLVPVLAPNHKQHILSSAKLRKVCLNFVRSIYLNLFGWRGREL
jgi:hypothetical protein